MEYMELYYDKCLENKLLKDEIQMLQRIVSVSLPILGEDGQE